MPDVGSQKMQKAAVSDCRSINSSQYPSGRLPKVSIGVTVDKCSKVGHGLTKEDASLTSVGGRTFPCKAVEETTGPVTVEPQEKNRSYHAENREASAWFSTRPEESTHAETPTAETVKVFVNKASVLEPEDGLHKIFDSIPYRQKREMSGHNEMAEVTFATLREVQPADKGNCGEPPETTANFNDKKSNITTYGKRRDRSGDVGRAEEAVFRKELVGVENGKEPEKLAKCNNEALKMKLWEILGSAPSENKHAMNSPNIMEHNEDLNTNRTREDQGGEKAARMKLNSARLEEDKENSNINQSQHYNKGRADRLKQNARELEEKKGNSTAKQCRQVRKGKSARARQASDTIESDSESLNQVTRRPVTRSLTRKRASPKRLLKLQGNVTNKKKPVSSSSSDFKLQSDKKNIFVFDEAEGIARSLDHSSSGHSYRPHEKIKFNDKAKTEPQKFHFHRSFPEKHLDKSDKEQAPASSEKASSQSKGKESSSAKHLEKEHFQSNVGTADDAHHSRRAEQLNFSSPLWGHNRKIYESTDSPLHKMKKLSWGHDNSPPEPKSSILHDNVFNRPMVGSADQLNDFSSPTFAVNVSPAAPRMPKSEALSSPAAAPLRKPVNNSYSTEDSDSSTQLEADTESSDGTRDMHKQGEPGSPFVNAESEKQYPSLSPMEEHDTESEPDDLRSRGCRLPSDAGKQHPFLSPTEELDTESEPDDHTSQAFGPSDKWFPSMESPTRSPTSLHHTKRARCLNNVERGNEKLVSELETLEQFPEGSLARCVAQLVLVLQRFKARMKSQASEKSSKILLAASDRIRQQLQDVEFQILNDLGKFNSSGKLKRKNLESEFQEQQQRLKLIHDKFKEEVNQHLLECRGIMEELEAQSVALEGTADRQKGSHRKLLVQAEEAMDAQINDAETRIADIHKDARKKMAGLQHLLKDWLD